VVRGERDAERKERRGCEKRAVIYRKPKAGKEERGVSSGARGGKGRAERGFGSTTTTTPFRCEWELCLCGQQGR